jgi:hypothetical protein
MIVESAAIYTFVSPLSRTHAYLHAAGPPTLNTSPSPVQPSLELGIANALIHARIRLGRTGEQSNSSRVTALHQTFDILIVQSRKTSENLQKPGIDQMRQHDTPHMRHT